MMGGGGGGGGGTPRDLGVGGGVATGGAAWVDVGVCCGRGGGAADGLQTLELIDLRPLLACVLRPHQRPRTCWTDGV